MRVRLRQVFSCLLCTLLLLPFMTAGVGAKTSNLVETENAKLDEKGSSQGGMTKKDAAKEAAKDPSTARLTETKGDVYRRGFVDWNRETWGDPVPAKVGDKLMEGMQVGTGEKSWAELTWRHVTSRAWEKSVYAIAPNQRLVYLFGGEMLFNLDKKRKDKSEYVIWTNLLQARLRGTTVLVQATEKASRLTVLEGTVDVLNRSDHSVVRLTPGAVYEVSSKAQPLQNSQAFAGALNASQAVHNATTALGASQTAAATNVATPFAGFNQTTSNALATVPLFETTSTITSLLPIDLNALLANPLLTGVFGTVFPSLALVQQTLGKLGSITDGTLLSSVQVVRLPVKLAYDLGPSAVSKLSLPAAALKNWPPHGIIGQSPGAHLTGGQPFLTGTLTKNAAGHFTSKQTDGVLNQLGNLANTGATGNAASLAPTSLLGGTSLLGAGLQPGLGGVLTGVGGAGGSIVGGVGSAGGSVLSGVGGAVTGLGGTVGGIGGVVGGIGGGGGGSGGGLLGGVGGALGGVGGALGGVGGALGGLGGALGGLGH